MSREPSSGANRYAEALGRSGAIQPEPDPLRKPQPPLRSKAPTVVRVERSSLSAAERAELQQWREAEAEALRFIAEREHRKGRKR